MHLHQPINPVYKCTFITSGWQTTSLVERRKWDERVYVCIFDYFSRTANSHLPTRVISNMYLYLHEVLKIESPVIYMIHPDREL
jgi:hypothetical protein